MKLMVVKNDRRTLADLLLIFVTLVWGTTFVVVKNALASIGAFWFISVRFWIAFLVLALIYRERLVKNWRHDLKISAIIGGVLFTGFALQTIGLQYTTAANSGFITGLSVVLVPIIGRWWGQKNPNQVTWIGIMSAVIGLGMLTLNGQLRLNIGDFFTLIAAIALACHIAMVGHYAPRTDAVVLAIMQIGAVAVIGTAFGTVSEEFPARFSTDVLIALAITAIPATAIAFLVQNAVQKYTTATRTAIIFALEPVFSGITAYLVLGEVLTTIQLVGCCLIVIGMIISEIGG